ncbi:putative LRR receptor-like serine/threonine-protein kinase [Hordeum vulgare]|nr:putative LRR receptor-like serine/threonine-protein kinase [Hordeum vulgare]
MRLSPGKTWTLDVPEDTDGEGVWARTGCSFDAKGNGSCQTGDCGGLLACKGYGQSPYTSAEFRLNQFGGNGFIYISLYFGFNVPMEFLPVLVKRHGIAGCSKGPHCATNITSHCPNELKAPGGCNTACDVFRNESSLYCCPRNVCEPNKYSSFFVQMCPEALSFSSDAPLETTFSCPRGTNYNIIFCPPINQTSSPPSPPLPSKPPSPPDSTATRPSSRGPSSSRKVGTSVSVAVAGTFASFTLIVTFIIFVVHRIRTKRNHEMEEEEVEFSKLQGTPMRFTFQQLEVATEQFKEKLGEGRFRSVFEGTLGEERIAVKRLDREGQGKREFLAEVQTIGSIHHINLVIGDDFNAKISDFGLCKLIDRDISQVVTRMRGTPGYLAPEWLTSQITEKADVYSFGVVVMEIVSGRKNLDTSRSEESIHLITLLEEKVKNNQLADLIDKNSNDMPAHEQDVIEMMKLAMWCLQIDCKRRPKMSEVVKVLEGTIDAESDIDHNFVATNQANFGIAGNVTSSAPPLASHLSGPR